LTAGTLTIGSGSVTDSSGAISFGNENLTTTGIVTAAGTSVFTNLDISGDIDVDGTTNLDVLDVDGAVNFAADVTFADGADLNHRFSRNKQPKTRRQRR
jgi:large exoprotein involved in heme utilization and adhesion